MTSSTKQTRVKNVRKIGGGGEGLHISYQSSYLKEKAAREEEEEKEEGGAG